LLRRLKECLLIAGAVTLLAACQNQATPAAGPAEPGTTPGSTPGARRTGGALAAPTALPTRVVTTTTTVAVDGVLALARPLISAAFTSSDKVTAVHAAPGQTVKPGDVLAELDTATLSTTLQQAQQALALQQAQIDKSLAPATQTDLDTAKANLSSAYAAYAELKKGPIATDVDAALRSWNQAKNSLYSTQLNRDQVCGIVPGSTDLDTIKKAKMGVECKQADLNVQASDLSERTAYQKYLDAQKPATADKLASAWSSIVQAQASLATLQNGVSAEQKAVYDVQLAQAKVKVERAQRDLAQAQLLSPCACVVQAVGLSVGGSSSGGSITLLDASQVKFQTSNLNEEDVVKLQAGQAVTIRLKAFPQTFTGKVSAILPLSSGTQGSVALFTANIDLDPAPANVALLPGMTGQAEIILK
jgi:multidrug efflux pump subunit AcrA (membrane-fusion protein)